MTIQPSAGRLLATLLLAIGLGHACPAAAAIVLDRTRVVFPAEEKEVVLALENDGDQPFLLQSWIADSIDDVETSAENSTAPFVLVPPLQRVNAGARSNIRIRALSAALPTDRESVFWLHVLAIPGTPIGREKGDGRVELAIETRLKVFWRPKGLAGSGERADGRLRWRLLGETAPNCAVDVENPSGYYVTLVELAWAGPRASSTATADADSSINVMLDPWSKRRIELPCPAADARSHEITYSTMSDTGMAEGHQASLLP